VLFDRLQSADLARHPLLAGREFLDVACYLLLSDGDPVDGLPHRVEIKRYRVEPRLVEKRGSLRRQPGRAGRAIRNWRGSRLVWIKEPLRS
jgi:hypothetical protein